MQISDFVMSHIRRSSKNVIVLHGGLIFLYSLLWLSPLGIFPFSLVVAVLFFWSIWNLVKALRGFLQPQNHQIIIDLTRYGDAAELSHKLESEAKSGGKRFLDGRMVTTSWYYFPKFSGMDLVRISDVVWAYEKVRKTKRRYSSQSDYYVILKTKDGSSHEVAVWGRETSDFLQLIKQASPKALMGFSAELEQMWNQNKDVLIKKVLS